MDEVLSPGREVKLFWWNNYFKNTTLTVDQLQMTLKSSIAACKTIYTKLTFGVTPGFSLLVKNYDLQLLNEVSEAQWKCI